MTYYVGIPALTDRPSQSAVQFASNFTTLNTIFGIDHITFNAAQNRGWHLQVTLPVSAADPATGLDRGLVYTKQAGGAGTTTELYYRYDSSATPASRVIQLSCVKAWCRFNGTLASPIAIVDGVNVTNVTKTGVGTYVINFARPLVNANYSVFSTCALNPAHAHPMVPQIVAATVNNCTILTRKSDNVTLDSPLICVSIIGN